MFEVKAKQAEEAERGHPAKNPCDDKACKELSDGPRRNHALLKIPQRACVRQQYGYSRCHLSRTFSASISNHIGRPVWLVSSGTASDTADAGLSPMAFVATTEQVYLTPLLNDETVIGDAVPDALAEPQVTV